MPEGVLPPLETINGEGVTYELPIGVLARVKVLSMSCQREFFPR
ncbi:hypothetical protein SSUR61_1217 [Streptococcus suis R61]|uniref:Uncharacterized protein n=1 Tax=Streptococcus suis R61 TaxID=996306 RepID=A0AA87F8T8_STRSU|nr:hypothetical protein SSUR61_1217 [Streptococcus suis R61]